MDAKSNSWGERLEPFLTPTIVVLVGLACFGLGRLSVSGDESPRLVINTPTGQGAGVAAVANIAAPSAKATAGQGGEYVASKSGTKYYLPTCGSANRIKEENKVWFDTKAEAEAAGYGPAANCPGL